jgi:type I restriction enzyme M protein
MNAKGAPVAVWSNGADSIILYRPTRHSSTTRCSTSPSAGSVPRMFSKRSKTLLQLKKNFNFKKIIQDLEELVLADSGKDEFNEIFKLIFAKIWDEKEALENRPNKVVEFRKALDPEITYDRINNLFHKACEEWPGIFKRRRGHRTGQAPPAGVRRPHRGRAPDGLQPAHHGRCL